MRGFAELLAGVTGLRLRAGDAGDGAVVEAEVPDEGVSLATAAAVEIEDKYCAEKRGQNVPAGAGPVDGKVERGQRKRSQNGECEAEAGGLCDDGLERDG